MRRRITHYPCGYSIGTIGLIHVLAEVGPILDRFDTAERAAAGHQPPPPFRCHRSARAVDPAKPGRSAQRRPLRGVIAPLWGSRVRDRTVWRNNSDTRRGRWEGGEVKRVLGQILRQGVWDRLDMLDELASNADNGSLLSVARSELPRLTSGWCALLTAHAPDPRGRCRECSKRWRLRSAPCGVWRTAHEHLVGAETVPQARAAISPLPVGADVSG